MRRPLPCIPTVNKEKKMLIPSCFHGLIKDVKKETMKVARKLLAGKTLEEAVAAYEMLDTRDFPDSVLQLRYGHQFLCKPDDFHFPYLVKNINDLLYKKYEDVPDSWNIINNKVQEVFVCLLEKDWGMLCLCDTGNNLYDNPPPPFCTEKTFDKRIRWFPYLKAMLKYWNVYVEMGDVFDNEVYYRNTIWEENNSLPFILGNLGIPDEVLNRPLPGMDLKKLIDEYGVFDVDINRLPFSPGLNIPILEKKLGEKNV